MINTRPKTLPSIDEFAEDLARKKLFDAFPTPQLKAKIDALITHRADLESKERKMLVSALRALAKRAESFAARLEATTPPPA